MAQVLPEMNNDRRRQFMKKRSIGILLLGLVVCTCISGCSSQSIADVNEKSIQAEEETETKDEKKAPYMNCSILHKKGMTFVIPFFMFGVKNIYSLEN